MIVTTTPSVDGKKIVDYKGVVVGEAILGANIFRDEGASIKRQAEEQRHKLRRQ